MMSGWIDRGEDLEVFQRAYRVSLEVHRIARKLAALHRGSSDI